MARLKQLRNLRVLNTDRSELANTEQLEGWSLALTPTGYTC